MAVDWRAFLAEVRRRGLIEEGEIAAIRTWFESIERAGKSVDPATALVRRGLLTSQEARAVQGALGTSRPRAAAPRGEATVPGEATGSVSVLDPEVPVASVVPGLAPVDLPGSRGGTGPVAAGKYEIERRLGRGGMGDVWLAVDRDLRREVAIKTIRDATDDGDLARFVFEAQVTGQLEHPNIVPVYELGLRAEDRQPFLVLKRVRGRALDEVLEAIRHGGPTGVGRIDEVLDDPAAALARLLDVFAAICQALAYAHSRGVVHRDLKPANVMVGEFGEVQIMDWGLAKVVGRPEGARIPMTDRGLARADRTSAGSILGTPIYMPPEQARGEIDRIDERSDVYSLGAMLYEMLSLARPFQAGQDLRRLIDDVSKGRLEPPTARSTAPWTIPAELEAVVLQAMARDPADRYPTAAALRADVEAWRDGRTLGAFEYSPWQLLAKWLRRHRTAAIGAAATVAAAVLGVAAVVVVARRTRADEEARLARERSAAAEERFAAAAELGEASMIAFNPAVPQDWFLARLPVVFEMGRALEEHPEPPDDWRRRLDREMDDLQAGAERVGEWALAEHLAGPREAWEVIPDGEGARRGARPAEVRLARARDDVARLESVLELVSGMEARSGFGALPGELDERAREVVRLPSRGEVVRALLARVAADNLRRQRDLVWGSGTAGPGTAMSLGERILAAEILGRIKDVDTIEGGLDAPGLVARTLRLALGLGLPADEVGAWIRAAGRLEAAGPTSFPAPGASAPIDRALLEYAGTAPVELAAERVRLFRRVVRDGEDPPAGLAPDRREALLDDLGDWAAARVASGSDYTGQVVERLRRGVTSEGRERILLDQLGLHGDALGPPGRSPVEPLRAALLDVPDDHLRDLAADEGAARRGRRRAIRAATNLARLGAPEVAAWLWERLAAGGTVFAQEARLALRLIEPARWPPPRTAPEEIRRTTALRIAGWNAEAIAAAGAILEADPRSAAALEARAVARMQSEDVEGAFRDAQAALAIEPDRPRALALRADARFRSGDHEGAMSDFSRAVELAPGDPVPINDRGLKRLALGDLAGGIADLEEAARLAPGAYRSHSNLAAALQRAGLLDRALEAANRAIELDPARESGYLNRALTMRKMGRTLSALADATVAVLLAPGNWTAFESRAICRGDTGDVAGALEDIERALDLKPDHPRLLVQRGSSRELLGLEDEALADFSRAIEVDPGYVPGWGRRAKLRAARGDRSGAIDDWTGAIEADPDLPQSWTERAILRLEAGDAPGAIEDLDVAVRAGPGLALAWHHRGRARRATGDLAGAAADLARAAELDPHWQPLEELAVVLAASGDPDGAARAFEEALRRAPEALHPRILEVRREALGR